MTSDEASPDLETQEKPADYPGLSAEVKQALTLWLEKVQQWYPDLHSRTYFFPPLRFSNVPYEVAFVADQPVLVPQAPSVQPIHYSTVSEEAGSSSSHPTTLVAGKVWSQHPPVSVDLPPIQESDVQDSAVLQRVLANLRALAEEQKEAMMVVAELDFRKYLDNQTDPISAAACIFLPRPATMAKKYRRGDFDLLIIHPQYGLIVGELKSIGINPESIKDIDKAIVGRVKKAMRQLNKAHVVLGNMLSDLAFTNIRKILIFPNITSTQMLHALSTDVAVAQELTACLKVSDVRVAVSQCLLSDSFSSTRDTVSSRLSQWWIRAVAAPLVSMTTSQYRTLLARFCGPATTVDVPMLTTLGKVVRSEAQAVAGTGLLMSRLALFPKQVDLLSRHLSSVYLCGPPGTGKTVVTVLKGLIWLKQGKAVQVVSMESDSKAVTFLIEATLQEFLRSSGATGTVHSHHFDYDNSTAEALDTLASLVQDRQLYVIMDEAWTVSREYQFTEFCTALYSRVPQLFLWAAGLITPDLESFPPWLSYETMTFPLRCPPSVQREVNKYENFGRAILRYDSTSCPAPTDGPAVRWLRHSGQRDHHEGAAEGCQRCGEVIADVLRELRVGVDGHDGLQYRDVFILCETRDSDGLVRGLRNKDVPVAVMGSDDDSRLRDMALALTDHVTVTDLWKASGLERSVVIGMGKVMNIDRLCSMSRSVAQLLWIT